MLADGLADLKEFFILFVHYQQRKEDRRTFDAKVRDKLVPRYMSAMETQLQRNKEKGQFLLGQKLSYADMALLEVAELLEEEYPGIIEGGYPLVRTLHLHLREMPSMQDYFSSTRRNPPLNDAYIAEVRQILSRESEQPPLNTV